MTKLRVMNTLDQTDRTDHEYPNSAGCCASRWRTSIACGHDVIVDRSQELAAALIAAV